MCRPGGMFSVYVGPTQLGDRKHATCIGNGALYVFYIQQPLEISQCYLL
jgi:hypothetical protein